jgi:ankyrin repeat protein
MTELDDRLLAAFHERDTKALRRLFEQHPELRARINDPLFAFDAPAIVAFAADRAIVDLLLDFGADPNRRSDWWAGGFHALHGATAASAERLIAAGATPDACAAAHLDAPGLLEAMLEENPGRANERGGDGQTPLHFARSRKVVDLLLDAGARIDARDVDHRSTPAEWMLERKRGAGRYDLARYLVERGAGADIFLAAALGLTSRVRELLAADPALLDLRTGRGDYDQKPPSSYHIYFWTIGYGLSPMDVAAQFEQQATLEAMRAVASPLQRLLFACRRGDESAARALLREYPGVLESIPTADHRVVADAAWRGDARAVALMLEMGFDPRAPGHDGGTALHCAAWEGSPEAVAVLLRHPHAPELIATRDLTYGATPLGWCCHGSQHGNREHDHARVAELLLAAGAIRGSDSWEASPSVLAVFGRWSQQQPTT